jgi:sulfite reductase beta subunit-like hemoprotein
MASAAEFLAQKAIQEIEKWLREEGAFAPPRLAIKFCGGCNPAYERSDVAQIIEESLPNVRWVSADAEADLLIIINGCNSSCAQRPEIEEKGRFCLAIREDGVSKIYRSKG